MRMVAYGDMRFTDPAVTSGTNPRVRKWLAEKIADEHPQALLLTGDMPYTGASAADWQVFQSETAPWRDEHILQLPTTGNHEVYGGVAAGNPNKLAHFPAVSPRRYYSSPLARREGVPPGGTTATPPSPPPRPRVAP